MTRLFVIIIALLFVAACDSVVRPIPRIDKDTVATADEDEIAVTDDDISSDETQIDDNIPDDQIVDDPLPDETVDTSIPDDATDDTVDDPFPDDTTDNPLPDDPVIDDATDDTIDDPVIDDPIVDDTTDTPVPDDTTDTAIPDDMTDDTTTDTSVTDDTADDASLPDQDTVGDTTPPTILGTLPQDEATGIPVDTTIEIQFSEPLDEATLTGSFELTLNSAPVAVATDWRSGDNTVILTPDTSLTPGANYTVTVKTTLTDLAGNSFEPEYIFEFTISLCGNGIPELGEQCDLGGGNGSCSVCTAACVTKPANFCGDGFICDTEQCETGQTATCAAALGDANALGTAPCNGTCGGFATASNCTRTFNCAAKPANSEWNTVDHYHQTWNGSAWMPADDATTEFNTIPSTESCRYTCAAGYVWNGIQCVVKPPNCGNGTPDAGEQCDDGNGVNADSCKNDCTYNTCGDGVAGGSLPTLIHNFESGVMPTTGVTNGTPGWAISTTQKRGSYSIRSATMGNNANATITFAGLSDGSICYYRAGSSETGYDYFTVTIDGTEKEKLSGLNQTWTQMCWPVTPGVSHTVQFRFAKDNWATEGWDAWYIDDLSFSSGATEQCDDGNAVNGDACKNDCTFNTCGDGVVYTGIETCDITGIACSTLLSVPAATGTAPCNANCTGYIPVGNCTKTNTCPAKPATGTSWNTVSSYPQSWTGSAWDPVDDTTTTYNATASATDCRFTCATKYAWSGTACVTTDPLELTLQQINKQNMVDDVTYLASSSCAGRNNNTTGSTNARSYIIDEMTAMGLAGGGTSGGWTQHFSYTCSGKTVTGDNIVGFLEGSDATLKSEYLVIGAHYDHLGTTSTSYYPGADDNASGVALMLEVARALKRIQPYLDRSVIFIGFDAEEDGLCGSEYYTAHPLYTLADTVYMLDLDMVGYLRNNAVELTDANGSTWGVTMLSTLADKYGINESFEDCGYECSDHAPFNNAGVPNVMITTGLEDVYHKTTDTSNLVNYDGMVPLTSYVTEFAYEVNVHTAPFLLYAPFEAPQIWQPREFRDHGILPANTPRD
ncbi:MAG TPA: M28 family peptidase [bacterium]|nr:M28 family peptidase [bacterium]